MTTIELKEQMKVLRVQQREAEKKVNKIKKDFKVWNMLMNEHPAFCWVNNLKGKFSTFEELITEHDWRNTKFRNREEWEFIFQELGFQDTEFFTAFMSWTGKESIEDRKCCVCMDYYNGTAKTKKKFANCSHSICKECYTHLRPTTGYKSCVVCRESEKPK